MSTESIVVLVVAALAAGTALVAALAVRRALAQVREGLVQLEPRLGDAAAAWALRVAAVRERLAGPVRSDTERTLWMLALLDARIEAARSAMTARRAASDTLRASMLRNRGALGRVRNSAQLLLRAIEMRRDFLA